MPGGGAGGASGGSQPPTPLSPSFFDHVFSPLGSRRSPRLAPIKTSSTLGGPAAPDAKGKGMAELVTSTPAFTPAEMQLLLATLGGACALRADACARSCADANPLSRAQGRTPSRAGCCRTTCRRPCAARRAWWAAADEAGACALSLATDDSCAADDDVRTCS
jgi:hypothetical protein